MAVDTTTTAPNYPLPSGFHPIPSSLIDSRPDTLIDATLLSPSHPSSTTSQKNIWFFWHSGYSTMHPYAQRTIRAYHRRFSKLGWTIRVVDRVPGSSLNISNFLDTSDPKLFPQAFREGTLDGKYALQHYSDLVRWPLLWKYGGVYADVGFIQIGNLDALWERTVGDEGSGYEVLSYLVEGEGKLELTNYFMGARKGCGFFARGHDLLMKVWEGRRNTEGLWEHELLKGVPTMGGDFEFVEEGTGRRIGREEAGRMLTDYIIQGQVMSLVMGLVDEEGGWDGPKYVREKVYGLEFMTGSQLVNVYTEWNGRRAFKLMSLEMPKEGGEETEEQRFAREVVEGCLTRSFGFKLAHGMILAVMGETLGSLWRANPGSDVVPGTYAAWFRCACAWWTSDRIPERVVVASAPTIKRGPLLRAA